ncbi:uncharacterized protein TM35_000332280 [Trypanosoma theileri]|uniref:Uncharacterized protein n=1 Tax=Trypanosoma theileri TaxID=67003 RepID=A0A1X0NMH1_9TRYP|nr:uncharacterized protein TM35_000332280 [Trypanosoma theileri]ORC85771.1 hypothetical protein TM35_000332280 [Trypanosoma theileri]
MFLLRFRVKKKKALTIILVINLLLLLKVCWFYPWPLATACREKVWIYDSSAVLRRYSSGYDFLTGAMRYRYQRGRGGSLNPTPWQDNVPDLHIGTLGLLKRLFWHLVRGVKKNKIK